MGDTERGEPVAYAFEVTATDDDRGWEDVVKFKHPSETYEEYDGFEVRNIQPLYARDDVR